MKLPGIRDWQKQVMVAHYEKGSYLETSKVINDIGSNHNFAQILYERATGVMHTLVDEFVAEEGWVIYHPQLSESEFGEWTTQCARHQTGD